MLSLSGDLESVSQKLKNLRKSFEQPNYNYLPFKLDLIRTQSSCWKLKTLKDTRMRCMMRKNILTLSLFGSKGIHQSILKFWSKEISLSFCRREMNLSNKESLIKKSQSLSKPSGAFNINQKWCWWQVLNQGDTITIVCHQYLIKSPVMYYVDLEKRRHGCLQRLVQSIRKYHPNISIIIADDSPGNGDKL